jgi:hypothetical protein
MIAARGAEESTAWRQPADLVALCQTAAAELPRLITESRGRGRWSDHAALAHALLGDEPVAIMDAVESAVCAGATPPDLGRSLAYAAHATSQNHLTPDPLAAIAAAQSTAPPLDWRSLKVGPCRAVGV